MNQNNVYVNGNAEAQMNGYFYDYYELDAEETLKQGRQMYRDVPYILLVSKGGKRKIPVKATEEHIKAYPKQWEQYCDPNLQGLTHLSFLGLKPSKVKDLEYFGIESLEDLVNKECPKKYAEFKKAAQLIINLREYDYEQSEESLQNSGEENGQQQGVRAERVREKQSSSGIPERRTKNNQENGRKVGFLEFNFGSVLV